VSASARVGDGGSDDSDNDLCLNIRQAEAIDTASIEDITLIQGPPGTGT
jgi:hypothetical protein